MLDLFSSIWFGVSLLVLIFIYSSIGSALPPVRQHRLLEMTEFEWFHWWPFEVLIALFSITLIVATIRRIPLRWVNAGVWTIHTGILILVAGSIYYFGAKVEGDVPVFRRKVVIDVPGGRKPAELLVRPGNEIETEGIAGAYHFRIGEIHPQWPIRSEEHAGQKAYSVMVEVTTPQQKFIRQLLAGYPQYTEDVIPGQGRAVKVTGKKLLDENIALVLDYAPQDHFFIKDSTALYVRSAGEKNWSERPITGLPRYNDHAPRTDLVWNVAPKSKTLSRLEVPIPPREEEDELQDLDVRVLGYLRYAFEQTRFVDGSGELYPVVGLSIQRPNESHDYELAAFDSQARFAAAGQIEFRWIESQEALDVLANPGSAKLVVTIPDQNITLQVPPSEFPKNSSESTFRKIEGSEYEFRIINTLDRLPLEDGRILAVAMVEIRTPQKSWTRMVAGDPGATQDMAAGAPDMGHSFVAPDPGIVMTYTAGPPPIVVAAGPNQPELTVFFDPGDGTVQRLPAAIGQALDLAGGWKLRVNNFYRRAHPESRPWIVPPAQRDRDAGENHSMVYVVLSAPGWQEGLWLPYNAYAFEDEQYSYPGRIRVEARRAKLADGREVELMFSRQRYELPAAVALDDFTLLTHQGGLIGVNTNVRNYISQLRFADGRGGWSERMPMSLNEPANKEGWWFFQSMWDPPSQGSAGMNYTGLGIGNRNGVHVQLAGVIIAVTGMLFTFYVKPMIIRRRRLRVYDQMAASEQEAPVDGKARAGREQRRAEPVEAGSRMGS